MIKNTDILSYVSKHNSLRPKLTVGFAAETENLDLNANDKLSSKNCDWIIANNVSDNEIGFDSEYNEVKIFYSTTLFTAGSNKTNGRYMYHSMDATIGGTTNELWLFAGTGDFESCLLYTSPSPRDTG